MTRPSTPTDVLAGRHRRPGPSEPRAVSCHGPRHTQIGHARPDRDAAPGLEFFEVLGLTIAVTAVVLASFVAARVGYQVSGWAGVTVAVAATWVAAWVWIGREPR